MSAKTFDQALLALRCRLSVLIRVLSTRYSARTRLTPDAAPLPNYLVRSRQDVRRNGEVDLLCCLKIDDQLELRRPLDWKIRSFGPFENSVDVVSNAAVNLIEIGAIIHESTGVHSRFNAVQRR